MRSIRLHHFTSRGFTIDTTDYFPVFIKYDNYFATDKQLPMQISYRVINETTLNVFYQKFSGLNGIKWIPMKARLN